MPNSLLALPLAIGQGERDVQLVLLGLLLHGRPRGWMPGDGLRQAVRRLGLALRLQLGVLLSLVEVARLLLGLRLHGLALHANSNCYEQDHL